MMKMEYTGINIGNKVEAKKLLNQYAGKTTLETVKRLAMKGEAMVLEKGREVIGAVIKITTAGTYRPATYGGPNASKIMLKRFSDNWHIMAVSPHYAGDFDNESVVVIEPKSEAEKFAERGFDAETRRMFPGIEKRYYAIRPRREPQSVFIAADDFGPNIFGNFKGPALTKGRNTRQPKDEIPMPAALEKAFADRRSQIERLQSVTANPKAVDLTKAIERMLNGQQAPKPSPEARRLDAIRAVYDAADEGNKVQSALSHAREIACDLGEIEPAKRISVLYGLIKGAQAECAEIARELAVSGK